MIKMIDIYFFIVYPISIIGTYGFRDGRYLIIKLNYFEAKEYEMRDAIDRRRMSVTVPNYIDLRTRLEVGLATRSGLKKRKGGGSAERSFPSDCQRCRGRNGQRRTVLVYTYIERRGFDVCLDVAKKYNDPNKTSCTRSSILSAISFPPSETVQVHEPRASRHGYLYSICGKREGGVGRKKEERIARDKSVRFFISYCQGFSRPLLSLISR